MESTAAPIAVAVTSTTDTSAPSPGKTLAAAKQQYVELFGSSLVLITYLKTVIVLLVLLLGGAIYANMRTARELANMKPLVIRIDDIGRAEAVRVDATAYTPQAAELRYFLTQFIAKHYGRVRSTLRTNFTESLYFLTPPLASATMQAAEQAQLFQTFLTSATDEVEVTIQNVTLDDLEGPEYHGTVDFEQLSHTPTTHHETKRQRFVAQVQFTLLTGTVPNSYVPINPLGIQITYFRADEAFR